MHTALVELPVHIDAPADPRLWCGLDHADLLLAVHKQLVVAVLCALPSLQ